MLKEIFGDCSTKQKLKINRVLEEIYDGRFKTVKRALEYYEIHISENQYERLVELVIKARQGATRELFEIDDNEVVRYWYVTDLDGERMYCAHIRNEEEWKKTVDYMAEVLGVDTDWGTIERGIRQFDGPDIYMFGKYKVGDIDDDPESSWYGSKIVHTFLVVDRYQNRKELYGNLLKNIVEGENNSKIGVVK